MKTMKLLLSIMLFLSFCELSLSQSFYQEQNSGVTTHLTSVWLNPVSNSNNLWVCGSGGIVLKTTTAGVNWINVSGNGIPNTADLVNIWGIDANNALTAGFTSSNTFVYRTSNGGSNWTQVFSQPNGFIDAIWMYAATQGFMYGDPVGNRWSLWKTSNGGFNWDSTGMYLPQAGTEAGWNNALAIQGNRIFFGTDNSRIYRSTNLGATWLGAPFTEVNTTAIWFYPIDSLFGYIGGSNSYQTTNGGVSWTLVSCLGTGLFSGFMFFVYGVTHFNPYPPQGSLAIRNDNNVYSRSGIITNWAVEYTAPTGNYTHMTYIYIPYGGMYGWAVRSNGGITRIAIFRGGEVKNIIRDSGRLSIITELS